MEITLKGISPARIAFALMAVLCLFSIAYGHYKAPEVIEVSTVEYRRAAVPIEVKDIKYIKVPVHEVEVIEKEKVVYRMPDIPAEVYDPPQKQIAALGEFDCPEHSKATVASVIDTDTGRSTIFAKTVPVKKKRPFFELMNSGAVGLRYGFSTSGPTEASAFGSWTFARAGGVHLSLYMEGNSGAELKGQLEAAYKW
jgi:hypothetical protein